MVGRLAVVLVVALALVSGWTTTAAAAPVEAPGAEQPPRQVGLGGPAQGDFLSENGLRSPVCTSGATIPRAASEHCEADGFSGSAEPLSNYGFDVHINTGITEPGNDVAAAAEDVAQWAWLTLLAVLRGLLVMMEWAYSIHLLGSAVLAKVGVAIAAVRSALTTPGLAVSFSVLAVLLAYNGLVRRRHVQGVGEASAAVAMVVVGLVAVARPQATVGQLSAWSDQAALASLATFDRGVPGAGMTALADAVRMLYSANATPAWCFLEFGDVPWCERPDQLDSRLRAAALALAGQVRADAPAPDGELLREAEGLEKARTNGQLFLALPANGPARNSINDQGSLLSALCGGSTDATNCRGPTARQAEFRTEGFLGERLVGLILIWAGLLGTFCLYGWLIGRLLGSAVVGLALTMAAPVVVLAPPLGLGGRNLFRSWAVRLVGALTTKLVLSLLLGVLLLLERVLIEAEGLGFWIYWLLCSSSWWLVFLNRHSLLSALRFGGEAGWGELAPRQWGSRVTSRTLGQGAAVAGTATALTARVGVAATRRAAVAGGRALGKRKPRQSTAAERGSRPSADRPAPPQVAGLADRLAVSYLGFARAQLREAGPNGRRIQELERRKGALEAQRRTSERLARTGRLRERHREQRRLASLDLRQAKVGEELDRERANRRRVERLARAFAANGRAPEAYRRFVAQQRKLPNARSRGLQRRDYRRLAPLIDIAQERFDQLRGSERCRAILAIDRLLDGRGADRDGASFNQANGGDGKAEKADSGGF